MTVGQRKVVYLLESMCKLIKKPVKAFKNLIRGLKFVLFDHLDFYREDADTARYNSEFNCQKLYAFILFLAITVSVHGIFGLGNEPISLASLASNKHVFSRQMFPLKLTQYTDTLVWIALFDCFVNFFTFTFKSQIDSRFLIDQRKTNIGMFGVY